MDEKKIRMSRYGPKTKELPQLSEYQLDMVSFLASCRVSGLLFDEMVGEETSLSDLTEEQCKSLVSRFYYTTQIPPKTMEPSPLKRKLQDRGWIRLDFKPDMSPVGKALREWHRSRMAVCPKCNGSDKTEDPKCKCERIEKRMVKADISLAALLTNQIAASIEKEEE